MSSMDDLKREAARAALAYLPEQGDIGLGTGSTAKHFVDGVGELVRQGRRFRAVATSEQSRAQALALGIELLPDDGPWELDLCVDGADEVSDQLDLIKGGGAAHTREKIVNRAAKLNVIVVDESKLSARLGTKWPIPVEVLRYGHLSTAKWLSTFGEPTLRQKGTEPVQTDSGNWIYDLRVAPCADPAALEAALALVPGVVESGLFVGRTDVVLVAGSGGVRKLVRTPT